MSGIYHVNPCYVKGFMIITLLFPGAPRLPISRCIADYIHIYIYYIYIYSLVIALRYTNSYIPIKVAGCFRTPSFSHSKSLTALMRECISILIPVNMEDHPMLLGTKRRKKIGREFPPHKTNQFQNS